MVKSTMTDAQKKRSAKSYAEELGISYEKSYKQLFGTPQQRYVIREVKPKKEKPSRVKKAKKVKMSPPKGRDLGGGIIETGSGTRRRRYLRLT